MDLPDQEELITPVDDPYQYDPAWRSKLADYVTSKGRFSEEDLKSIARIGCAPASRVVCGEKDKGKGKDGKDGKDGKKGKASPKMHTEDTLWPIYPFSDSSKYRQLLLDKWLVRYIILMNETEKGNRRSLETIPFELAKRWHDEVESESIMRKRLEPMLLTDVGTDIIAMDLMGEASAHEAVEAYEKMYFNCRDNNFNLSGSMQLITRMAMPYGPLKAFLRKWETLKDGICVEDGRPIAKDSDVWRAVAATMGYEPLMYMWRWERKAHGITDRSFMHMLEISWRASIAKLISEIFTGTMSNEDMAKNLATLTMQMKYLADEKRGGGSGAGAIDAVQALMEVMHRLSPHMVTMDEADESARNEEIQSRIASQLAISRQAIEDKGAHINAEVIDAQISNAISTE